VLETLVFSLRRQRFLNCGTRLSAQANIMAQISNMMKDFVLISMQNYGIYKEKISDYVILT